MIVRDDDIDDDINNDAGPRSLYESGTPARELEWRVVHTMDELDSGAIANVVTSLRVPAYPVIYVANSRMGHRCINALYNAIQELGYAYRVIRRTDSALWLVANGTSLETSHTIVKVRTDVWRSE